MKTNRRTTKNFPVQVTKLFKLQIISRSRYSKTNENQVQVVNCRWLFGQDHCVLLTKIWAKNGFVSRKSFGKKGSKMITNMAWIRFSYLKTKNCVTIMEWPSKMCCITHIVCYFNQGH